MIKRTLVLLVLAGGSTLLTTSCCGADPYPSAGDLPPTERDLREVRATLSTARTARIRIQGEWPHALGRMPRSVAGTILLGEKGRAKISLKSTYAGGGSQLYEAVTDGTALWRSPKVEEAKFNPGSGGLREELTMALAWYGIGWAFPQGPHPKTLGEGYVICDLLPQERDIRASFFDGGSDGTKTISHLSPGIEYRIRLSFDPSTMHLRQRELIGDKGVIWYVEKYPEVVLNAAIPEDEFKLPGK